MRPSSNWSMGVTCTESLWHAQVFQPFAFSLAVPSFAKAAPRVTCRTPICSTCASHVINTVFAFALAMDLAYEQLTPPGTAWSRMPEDYGMAALLALHEVYWWVRMSCREQLGQASGLLLLCDELQLLPCLGRVVLKNNVRHTVAKVVFSACLKATR